MEFGFKVGAYITVEIHVWNDVRNNSAMEKTQSHLPHARTNKIAGPLQLYFW